MKNCLSLLFILSAFSLFAQDITGTWNGLLKAPGAQVPLAIHIVKSGATYTGTMDSPTQGATGIPLKTMAFANGNLIFTLPEAGIQYVGAFENNAFKGIFSQGGNTLPLDFSRNEQKVEKPLRPQEPVKPYPYHEEEVTFKNDAAGITLAGTLTLPKKEGVFPVVILVTGSGPQDRNEELLGHKPFLVLADHLVRNGIAVLRYDDRGVGKSTGDFSTATSGDFASDAGAAFSYLKTRKEINKKKIGLMGHSEGGIIAPMVAEKNADAAFVVMLAGPGIPGTEQMVLQNYLMGKADGMPEEELTKLGTINRKLYDAAISGSDPKAAKAAVRDILNLEMGPLFASKGIPQSEINNSLEMQAAGLTSPWYIYFLKHNPAAVIEKLKCPILALNGEKDLQVAPTANLEAIKRAAEKGGNKRVTVKQLPGLNHLFQECTTCLISEYGTLEQTFSPAALNEISGWISKQVK